ncbi:hypothetical protein R1T16_05365 [Flavobacterium sp. DG1-102-2]|uniref:M949_RS01915 family surface polysaccharide biosynthesis protein n=1 Tax=Flavobacterium sp. DG1-102-2 TaxID=3081663 RepID=UPI002948E449|nr:hypothetical protein [Flavobacterium sp. DG1-102-2]MDV6167843.1 hypothetical protein [Flavobacterium sp. DG1-102-2]
MKKSLFFFLLSIQCFSQIKTIAVKAGDIPRSISYTGNIIKALRYTDKLGDNLLITTETGVKDDPYQQDGQNTDSAELFAYHYTLKNGTWTLNWKIYDFVKECPVNVVAQYIKNAITITDIDNDKTAEVWLTYLLACHGDVSPCDMKVIMYENGKKYAMRGENRIQAGENFYMGGEYKFDKVFNEGPKQFRGYAEKLWNKYKNPRP